jgi:hypothetical protein
MNSDTLLKLAAIAFMVALAAWVGGGAVDMWLHVMAGGGCG